jgi:hypothetical protein
MRETVSLFLRLKLAATGGKACRHAEVLLFLAEKLG